MWCEALRVNRSWHENTDLVRRSEGRGQGYACCIYKEGQRPQKTESLGVLVSKQGQEKISGDIQWHTDVAVRVRKVHVFSFPRENQNI